MASLIPSWPYPPPGQRGFWEPVTSTLQWCEEDYYLTSYSAEIVNAFTNALYIWLAYEGVRSCRKHGHDTVFTVAYVGYFLVGMGSFMFHSTLKYPWQLVDELNMIYTTCLMLYTSLSFRRTVRYQVNLGVGLTAFCAFITAYYHYLQDPVFHQTVYGLLTTFIVLRSVWIMETSLRPCLRHSEEKDRQAAEKRGEVVKSKMQQEYENTRDLKILKKMWVFVAFGLLTFLGGFAMWGLDIQYCSNLRVWRRSVGMPWGFFLEFHGWWHLMTGLGAYCYIVWGIHLRHILNGSQEDYVFVWPAIWRLPEIVKKGGSNALLDGKANGHVNGNAKSYVNGSANGQANGHANGYANGHAVNGKVKC